MKRRFRVCVALAAGLAAGVPTTAFAADTTPPVVTVPSDIRLVEPNSFGLGNPDGVGHLAQAYNFDSSALDDVDGALQSFCTSTPGPAFNIGFLHQLRFGSYPVAPITITCTATDAAGNTGSNSFTFVIASADPVFLDDGVSPRLYIAASNLAAFPAPNVIGLQNEDGWQIVGPCTPVAGTLTTPSALATITVNRTCTATSALGVTREAPVPFALHSPFVTCCDVGAGTRFTVPVGATPRSVITPFLTPGWSVICTPALDVALPAGSTLVTCGGNTIPPRFPNGRRAEFTVDVIGGVVDRVPPRIRVPASFSVREPVAGGGVNVTYTVSANDNVDGPVTPYCSPESGSGFFRGVTRVTCTATDRAGNTATKRFSIRVLPPRRVREADDDRWWSLALDSTDN